MDSEHLYLQDYLVGRPIILLPLRARPTFEEVDRLAIEDPCAPAEGLVTCDFYIDDIEKKAKETPYGWEWGLYRLNIDHHAPVERMRRFISSTNLAIDWVRDHGEVPATIPIVINHVDCDSVLSASIMAGFLKPQDRFGIAAVAADHTGEFTHIGELLQALQPKRNLAFSLDNLGRLLDGRQLDQEAEELISKRAQHRAELRGMLRRGEYEMEGEIACLTVTEDVDAGLLPDLLPDAGIICLVHRRPNEPDRWNVSLRLGKKAIGRYDLQQLNITAIDPEYGGRWNAGSNKRGKGSWQGPATYPHLLRQRLEQYLNP